MQMKMGKMLVLAAIAAAVVCLTAYQAPATIWPAVEPDPTDSAYPDGSPQGYAWPCEIFSMTLDSGVNYADGSFQVKIGTNFGYLGTTAADAGSRRAYDAIYGNIWRDSYTSGVGMKNFATGDLYIRVLDKTGVTTKAVYGLVLEDRNGASDPWYTTLTTKAGYSYSNKTAGELYAIGSSGFATGTWEDYADNFTEKPDMPVAQGLPGLVDTTAARLKNAYPTILLAGNLEATFAAPTWTQLRTPAWGTGAPNPSTNPLGEWTADFTLPNLLSTDQVDVWWAMECGNDGARVSSPAGGDPVPLPGTLLLCGIGLAFAAVTRRFRRS